MLSSATVNHQNMMRIPSSAASEVALESKVAFLRHPTSFPEATYRVEAIETHMSWVFLTEEYAYKLKKPVFYDAIDFRALDARHFYCEEEVRLNRRLAAGVYLGLVTLDLNASGHLQLDGDAAVVDWLIKMRRLPARHMLDYAIGHGTASEKDMVSVAALLAGFYRSCPPIAFDPLEYRRRFQRQLDSYRQELSRPSHGLSIKQVNRICQAQITVLRQMAGLFDDRVRAYRIVEGHGDLRPEHVCLAPRLAIIDCLEFSRDLRIADMADELAFLALECERLGAANLGALLLRAYSEISGDSPATALIHFYQSYRATLRAAIAIRHLHEEKFRYSPEWRRRAEDYLQLAAQHVACCH
jgi:aminoglycoside phosphotransferase family enzyme